MTARDTPITQAEFFRLRSRRDTLVRAAAILRQDGDEQTAAAVDARAEAIHKEMTR